VARSADPVTPAAYSGSCKHINGSSANVVPANGVKAGCKFDAQICASVSQIPLSLDMRRRSTPTTADLEFDLVLAQAYAHAVAIEADLWLLLKKVGG